MTFDITLHAIPEPREAPRRPEDPKTRRPEDPKTSPAEAAEAEGVEGAEAAQNAKAPIFCSLTRLKGLVSLVSLIVSAVVRANTSCCSQKGLLSSSHLCERYEVARRLCLMELERKLVMSVIVVVSVREGSEAQWLRPPDPAHLYQAQAAQAAEPESALVVSQAEHNRNLGGFLRVPVLSCSPARV